MMAFIVNYVANREPIDRHANITTTISFSNLIIASSAVARAARQHVSLANSKIHAKRIAVVAMTKKTLSDLASVV
jgi:hypothetical protein